MEKKRETRRQTTVSTDSKEKICLLFLDNAKKFVEYAVTAATMWKLPAPAKDRKVIEARALQFFGHAAMAYGAMVTILQLQNAPATQEFLYKMVTSVPVQNALGDFKTFLPGATLRSQ